jgi:protein ImuB
VILWERDPRSGQLVIDCCRRARRQGVRVGMPLSEAQSLCQKGDKQQRNKPKKQNQPPCPAVLFYDQELDREKNRQGLEALAVWCERFSPLVGLETIGNHLTVAEQKAWQPAALVMDITGISQFFGSEYALAENVTRSLEQQGYFPRVAVADTVGCAWAAAHYHALAADPSQLSSLPARQPALLNTFMADANWPRLVPINQTTEVLSAFPVESLRLSGAVLSLLKQLGLESVGQLLQLPRISIQARLGAGLLPRLDQALGQTTEMIESVRPAAEYTARRDLEHPLSGQEMMEQVIGELLISVCHQLSNSGRGTLQLAVRLHGETSPSQKLAVGLYQPTVDAERITKLISMQLETLQLPVDMEVTLIEVDVLSSAKLPREQTELFADPDKTDLKSLRSLIDSLSSRLGMQQVVQPEVTTDPQPELACRWVPLAGQKKRLKKDQQKGATDNPRRRSARSPRQAPAIAFRKRVRPIELLSKPRRVDVVSISPSGAPARVRYAGAWQEVKRFWGPERIETAWWRGRSIRRDYYRVQTAHGERLWLYRCLRNGSWHLQGFF